MVHFAQKLPGRLLDLPEINQHAPPVQFGSPNHHFHLPVVAVEIFAFAAKIPQVVSGSKVTDDLYLVNVSRQIPSSQVVKVAYKSLGADQHECTENICTSKDLPSFS